MKPIRWEQAIQSKSYLKMVKEEVQLNGVDYKIFSYKFSRSGKGMGINRFTIVGVIFE